MSENIDIDKNKDIEDDSQKEEKEKEQLLTIKTKSNISNVNRKENKENNKNITENINNNNNNGNTSNINENDKVNKIVFVKSTSTLSFLIEKSFLLNPIVLFTVAIQKSDLIHLLYLLMSFILVISKTSKFKYYWDLFLNINKIILIMVLYFWNILAINFLNLSEIMSKENSIYEILGLRVEKNKLFCFSYLEFILLYLFGYFQNFFFVMNYFDYFNSSALQKHSLLVNNYDASKSPLKDGKNNNLNNTDKNQIELKKLKIKVEYEEMFRLEDKMSLRNLYSLPFYLFNIISFLLLLNMYCLSIIKPLSFSGLVYLIVSFMFIVILMFVISNNKKALIKFCVYLVMTLTMVMILIKYLSQIKQVRTFLKESLNLEDLKRLEVINQDNNNNNYYYNSFNDNTEANGNIIINGIVYTTHDYEYDYESKEDSKNKIDEFSFKNNSLKNDIQQSLYNLTLNNTYNQNNNSTENSDDLKNTNTIELNNINSKEELLNNLEKVRKSISGDIVSSRLKYFSIQDFNLDSINYHWKMQLSNILFILMNIFLQFYINDNKLNRIRDLEESIVYSNKNNNYNEMLYLEHSYNIENELKRKQTNLFSLLNTQRSNSNNHDHKNNEGYNRDRKSNYDWLFENNYASQNTFPVFPGKNYFSINYLYENSKHNKVLFILVEILIVMKVLLFQTIYLHSNKILFLVTIYISISMESMVGVLIFSICLLTFFLEQESNWRYSYIPIVFISKMIISFIYLCNLGAFKRWMTKDYQWLGVFTSNESINFNKELIPYIIIIFFGLISRIVSIFSRYYSEKGDAEEYLYINDAEKKKEIRLKTEDNLHYGLYNNHNYNNNNNNHSLSYSTVYSNSQSFKNRVNFKEFSRKIPFEIYESKTILLLSYIQKSLQYFWFLYGFHLVLVIIMIISFVDINILSLIYLLFVGINWFSSYYRTNFITEKEIEFDKQLHSLQNSWYFFSLLFGITSFFQYLNFMWFPPSWKLNKPWENFPFLCSREGRAMYSSNSRFKDNSDYEYCVRDWRSWLLLDYYNSREIFISFMVVFLIINTRKYFCTGCEKVDHNVNYENRISDIKLNREENSDFAYNVKETKNKNYDDNDNNGNKENSKNLYIQNKPYNPLESPSLTNKHCKSQLYTSNEFPFIMRKEFSYSIDQDITIVENRKGIKDTLLYLLFIYLKFFILFYLIIISLIYTYTNTTLIYGVLIYISFNLLFNSNKLHKLKNNLWRIVNYSIFLVLASFMLFQTPIFPCPVSRDTRFYLSLEECVYEENILFDSTKSINEIYPKNMIDALYMLMLNIIGLSKLTYKSLIFGNFNLFILFILSLLQQILFDHPYQQFIDDLFLREKNINKKSRAFKIVQDWHLDNHWQYRRIYTFIEMMNHKLRRLDKKINEYSDLWKQTNAGCQNNIYLNNKAKTNKNKNRNIKDNKLIIKSNNNEEDEIEDKAPLLKVEEEKKDNIQSYNELFDEEKFKEEVERMLEDLIWRNDLEIAGLIHFKQVKQKLVILTKEILSRKKLILIKIEEEFLKKQEKNTNSDEEHIDDEVEVKDYAEEEMIILERKNRIESFINDLKTNLKSVLEIEIKKLQEIQVCRDKLMLYENNNTGLNLAYNKYCLLYDKYAYVHPDLLCFADETLLNLIFSRKDLKDNDQVCDVTLEDLKAAYLRQKVNSKGIINSIKIGINKNEDHSIDSIDESIRDNKEYLISDSNKFNNNNEENNKDNDKLNGTVLALKEFVNKEEIESQINNILIKLRDPILIIDLIKRNYLIDLIKMKNSNYRNSNKNNDNFKNILQSNQISSQVQVHKAIKADSVKNKEDFSELDNKDLTNLDNAAGNKEYGSNRNLKIFSTLQKKKQLKEELNSDDIKDIKDAKDIKSQDSMLNNDENINPNTIELLFFTLYSNIEYFLIFAFLMNCFSESSLLTIIYPLIYFGYGLIEYPFPSKAFWKILIKYSAIVLFIKLLFQLPLFCGYPFYSVFNVFGEIYCENYNLTVLELTESSEYLIGLRKYNGEYSYPKNYGLFNGIFWDVVILILLLIQRSFLKDKGVWNFIDINQDFSNAPVFIGRKTTHKNNVRHNIQEYNHRESKVKSESYNLNSKLENQYQSNDSKMSNNSEYTSNDNNSFSSKPNNTESSGSNKYSSSKDTLTERSGSIKVSENSQPEQYSIKLKTTNDDENKDFTPNENADLNNKMKKKHAGEGDYEILDKNQTSMLGIKKNKFDDNSNFISNSVSDNQTKQIAREKNCEANKEDEETIKLLNNKDANTNEGNLKETNVDLYFDDSSNIKKNKSGRIGNMSETRNNDIHTNKHTPYFQDKNDNKIKTENINTSQYLDNKNKRKSSLHKSTLKDNFDKFLSRLVPEIFSTNEEDVVYKPGKDLYPQSFACLLTILIYTLFFFSSMTGRAGQSILDSLDKQQFSKDLVWTIIFIVSIIVADRIIYKMRSINNEFIFKRFKEKEHLNVNASNNKAKNTNTKQTSDLVNNNKNNASSNSNCDTSSNKSSKISFSKNKQLEKEMKEDLVTSNIAIISKIVLHYFLLILTHYIIFFKIPLTNHISFFDNSSLQFLYLLCWIYFYYSASQIKAGFPLITRGQSFVNSTKTYNRIAFKTYRNVPFLYELRAILDWTITKTSLDLFQWFKLEDAYANLYEVKCEMVFRINRHLGEPQIMSQKILWGFCFYLFLMFMLLVPMFLFSTFNPNLIENPALNGKLNLNLELRVPNSNDIVYSLNLFEVNALRINKLNSNEEFLFLKNNIISHEDDIDERKVQKVKVVNYSQLDWILSPPTINHLLGHLEKKVEPFIEVQWEFKREYPLNSKFIMGGHKVKLNSQQVISLRNILFALKSHQYTEKYRLLIKGK